MSQPAAMGRKVAHKESRLAPTAAAEGHAGGEMLRHGGGTADPPQADGPRSARPRPWLPWPGWDPAHARHLDAEERQSPTPHCHRHEEHRVAASVVPPGTETRLNGLTDERHSTQF
jgi:hypothetical protein